MLVHLRVIPTITSPSLIYTFGCIGTLWELSVFFKNKTYWLQSKSESGSPRRHNVHTNSSRKRKRFSNRRNLKTLSSCYNVDRKHFDDFTMIMWFPHRVFFNYKFKAKITADCCVLNASGIVWTKNIWCVFRVKPLIKNSSGALWTAPKLIICCFWFFLPLKDVGSGERIELQLFVIW